MTRTAKKPRKNPWDKDYAPYGTYEGDYGSPSDWAAGFRDAWDGRVAVTILKDESPWDVLGVVAGSSLEVVKAAYRKLVLIWHPDKPTGDSEKCRLIIAAYSTLLEQLK